MRRWRTVVNVHRLAFAIACVYGPRRAEPSRLLNAATRGGTGTQAARRTQRALVVAQVTLAVTVILGAGLVARSQLNLETLDLGLAGDRILVVQVVPPQQDDFANPKRFNAGLDRIIEAVAALPGVQGVAPLLSEPFGGMVGWDARYLLDGQAPEEEARQPLLSLEIASPAFFQTLGIEIVRGRAFTDEDSAEGRPVVILSESAARLAWPNKDAVGERMKIAGTWATVVGVAANTRYRELTVLRPTAYRPRDQFEAALPFLAVRTAGDPIGLAPAIRRAGQAMWPGATFTSLRRLDGYSSESLARSRVTFAGVRHFDQSPGLSTVTEGRHPDVRIGRDGRHLAAARRSVAADLFHEGGHILFLDAEPFRLAFAVGVQAVPAFQAQVPLDGIRHDLFRAPLLDVRRSLQLGHQGLGDPDTAV